MLEIIEQLSTRSNAAKNDTPGKEKKQKTLIRLVTDYFEAQLTVPRNQPLTPETQIWEAMIFKKHRWFAQSLKKLPETIQQELHQKYQQRKLRYATFADLLTILDHAYPEKTLQDISNDIVIHARHYPHEPL